MRMRILWAGLLLVPLLLLGCHRTTTPMVVHVFRDRNGAIGKSIDAAIRSIGLQNPRTSSGAPIVIATFEFNNYQEGLATIGVRQQPDLVIVDSRADLPRGAFGGSPEDLKCAPGVTCVGVIPSWVSGKTREASERILMMITSNLPAS